MQAENLAVGFTALINLDGKIHCVCGDPQEIMAYCDRKGASFWRFL